MKFITSDRVRMYDTDAAQILFFAQQYRFSHDAWESLMVAEGFGFDYLFGESSWTMVMVHCEADYLTALRVGDDLEVHTWTENIGNTSFTISYEIFRSGELVGRCKTTQVTLDKGSKKKIPVPEEFRKALSKYDG